MLYLNTFSFRFDWN